MTFPQRILVYGDAKTGKTHFALSIVKYYKSPEDVEVFFLDLDGGAYPLLKKGVFPSEFTKSIHISTPSSFQEVIKDTEEALKEGLMRMKKKAIWVVIDNVGRMWELTREEYTQQVWGKSYLDLLIAKRKQAIQEHKGNKPVFSPMFDYQVINPMYFRWIESIKNSGLNFMLLTPAQPVFDEEEITRIIGWIPKGQKDDKFRVDTILFKYIDEGKRYTDVSGSRWVTELPTHIEGEFPEVIKVIFPKGMEEL